MWQLGIHFCQLDSLCGTLRSLRGGRVLEQKVGMDGRVLEQNQWMDGRVLEQKVGGDGRVLKQKVGRHIRKDMILSQIYLVSV